MGSFSSSHLHQQQAEDEAAEAMSSDLQFQQIINNYSPTPSAIHVRQLLIRCAGLISHSDFSAAYHILYLLQSNSSPSGDSSERLVHHFARALALRLSNQHQAALALASNSTSSTTTTTAGAITLISQAPVTVTVAAAAADQYYAAAQYASAGTNIIHHHQHHHGNLLYCYSSSTSASASGRGLGFEEYCHSSACFWDHHHHHPPPPHNNNNNIDEESLQSCYLSLNQITPFIRFCHLTANQAILEAIHRHDHDNINHLDQQVGRQLEGIHILDFDIMHGLQWPPLMQALAERTSTTSPPPMLRISATGHNLDTLNRTGDRLSKFAQSLGLGFQFHPLLILDTSNNINDDDHIDDDFMFPYSSLVLLPGESLVVNCTLYLYRLLNEDRSRRRLHFFLRKIKSLKPKVVTVAEREADHNHPVFLQRFVESLDHYAAIFDSLEATLPPNSRERLAVENIWFGREILDIVSVDGDRRRERHERYESWELMLRSCGFSNVPLSPFNLSQARLLLRLHYPSQGYQLQMIHQNHSLFLCWQNRPLFSVSSWH